MPDFEATWYPRIGKDATDELRRYRKSGMSIPLTMLFALGAGALLGTGTLGDVIGVALLIAALVSCGLFIWAQWRTAAAVSVWFGVERMRWLPRMTPERFDEWRRLRGLMTPDERLAAGGLGRASNRE